MKTLKARCHFAMTAPRAEHVLQPSALGPETHRPFALPSNFLNFLWAQLRMLYSTSERPKT